MSAVLEFADVSAAYGPFKALFGINLVVESGEAVALLGANGMGKTTVARVATGLLAPSSGTVTIEGVAMAGRATHRFATAGVAHATEGRSVFATLSVKDNLALSFRQTRGRRGVAEALDEAFTLMPALAPRRQQLAGTMSGGEQRMLSMARVLVEKPKLLVADELSLGLAPIVVDEIYLHLERLRTAGSAMLIVEQQVTHALDLCDRAVLLDHGAVSWAGPTADAGELISTRVFEHASVAPTLTDN